MPEHACRWNLAAATREKRAALGCRSASGAGEEAFGDGSDWLALDLGLEMEQFDRSGLVEPFALHDDATRLLDPGVVLDREPQRPGRAAPAAVRWPAAGSP
jgi:hypothetical protein